MAETSTRQLLQMRLQPLLALRRPDGAWPHRSGGSGMTETTCFGLLAGLAAGIPAPTLHSSLSWLASLQRPDGGFSPQTAVQQSNWVTYLAALTLDLFERASEQERALRWMLGLYGNESAWLGRTLRNTLGLSTPYPQRHQGWPWTEGTASWVMPTAFGLLALLAARSSGRFPALRAELDRRIVEAEEMLLERRCQDGGWNHGAPAALEVSAQSYPETTGVAMLALQNVPEERLPGAEALARGMLANTRSAGARSWLELALLARGDPVPPVNEASITCRTSLDLAMRVLALSAVSGNNVFKA